MPGTTVSGDDHSRREAMAQDRSDPDHEARTYGEAIDEQAEFEQLLREKGDYQAAVDAQRRGEHPKGEPKNVSGA
jgi:hypothetical protein